MLLVTAVVAIGLTTRHAPAHTPTAAAATRANSSASAGSDGSAGSASTTPMPDSWARITVRGATGSTATHLSAAFSVIRERITAAHLPYTVVTSDATSLTVTTPQAERAVVSALVQPGRLDFRPVLRTAVTTPVTGTWDFAAGANKIVVADGYTTQRCAAGAAPASPPDTVGIIDFLSTCAEDGSAKYLLGPVAAAGTDVTSASAAQDAQSGQWVVNVDFNARGAAYLSSVTGQLAATNGQLAIVLDCVVQSAPTVQQTITGGRLEISGSFTEAQAQSLSAVLAYGALPATLETADVEQYTSTIPPTTDGS